MAAIATQIALMVTRRCDMSCSHCSVASGPHVTDEPAEEDLLRRVQEAAAAGVRLVTLTGGEPMLREELVLRLLRECRRLGMATRLVTDASWGKTPSDARVRLKALRKAGLGFMTLSYDRYHAAFQSHDSVLNIARAAEELFFRTDIHLVRDADDSDLARLIGPFEGLKNIRLRFYDLQPVGRARLLDKSSFRAEDEGFCSACAFPVITDDGRLLACNGPAYFSRPGSPLQIGSVRDVPLQTLLEQHWTDPILDTIRTLGPSGLRAELRQIPGFEQFPFRDRYSGMCELCHHITGNPEAVSALRTRLAAPARVAQRQALSLIIQASRGQGPLNRQYVNSVGACRIFDRLAWDSLAERVEEADHVLGRADLDWSRLGAYLAECGLARPLAKRLNDRVLTHWAPPFFLERLASRALQDEKYERAQQDALHRIAAILREAGERAVLLDGSMLPLMPETEQPRRTTPRLHLYVQPTVSASLRESLLKAGGQILLGDRPLVIQDRLMPAWWNLSERDMLACVTPIDGQYHDVFFTLNPEGMLLHAGMHASVHLFSCGLKTAWDLRWILGQTSLPDWDRLARWVEGLRAPRGFWTTVSVLAASLDIPIPVEFLRRGPADARQGKLATIARHLLFTAHEPAQTVNPFNKVGVLLFLHDSWLSRIGYLTAMAPRTPIQGMALLSQLRETWRTWRAYRIILEQGKRAEGIIPSRRRMNPPTG